MISQNTPRLRITFAWYALLLALVAVSERNSLGTTGGAIASLAGLVLMASAALGRIWTSVHIAGQKNERLVTSGPYAKCRHPLYALSLLGGLGVGLATRSIVLTLATLLLLLVLQFRAIRAEERRLRDAHGAAFERYCAQVPRLMPRWSNREESPVAIPVAPAVLWKAFLDAGAFILIYVVIALIDVLQSVGALPTWLTL